MEQTNAISSVIKNANNGENELKKRAASSECSEFSMDQYEKIKVVGQGSFGVAVLYRRLKDEMVVVLKHINLSELSKSEMDLAMNEVDIFSKLHHPNIIRYMGSFIKDRTLSIEMEYADGGTLAQIISEKEPNEYMPERFIIRTFEQITSAISYMHSESIMHRDLKTANIFLNKRGIVKIGDFGISKIINTHIQAHTILGTPYYFSPEMCEGKEYNDKSDIWALGCILCEMCCLRKAFSASNLSELVAKIMSSQYLPPPIGYSDGLKYLVKNLLQSEPGNRPPAVEVLKYWIPLVYRNLPKQKGYQYDHTYEDHDQELLNSEEKEYMDASTATLSDPIKERSILYQLKCFGGDTSLCPIQLPATVKITMVATNSSHFLAVASDGVVYSWGEGNKGQLGHGNIDNWKHYPCKIDGLKDHIIVGASAGGCFSLFWTNYGQLFSCGDNSKGCLGQTDFRNSLVPKIIEPLEDIKVIKVVSGNDHVLALGVEGDIFTWGTSRIGALGIGQKNWFSVPRRINLTGITSTVKSIYAGPDCSLLLFVNGDVYACGNNNDNKLGFGKSVKAVHEFTKLNINANIVDLSVSTSHSAFCTVDGYVHTLGKNSDAQRGLGHNSFEENITFVENLKSRFIKSVKCSFTHTVAYTDDNVLLFWGTRLGIPEFDEAAIANEPASSHGQKRLSELGNSTSAFTHFLASVYKTEIILNPTEILALYSSPSQVEKGNYIKITDILPLHHSMLILVDTTNPVRPASSGP